VGIFSIFKRKSEQPGSKGTPADARARAGEPTRMGQPSEAERARQREIARATAAKIDAIESAMALDIFNEPEPAWGTGLRPGQRAPRSGEQAEAGAGPAPTLPMVELATTELLADDVADEPTAPETAPVVEEIAIMFANGQLEVAEQMLMASLGDAGRFDRTVWWMLFDLYQIRARQDDFDNVAIDYASRFETSPPSWAPVALLHADQNSYSGVAPTEALTGVLDEHIEPQLQRLLQLAATHPVLRLELGRINDVTPDGCARLLTDLAQLRASGRELIVAGAAELAALLRSTIAIGKRDASEAPWLLLLELLQLLNREKDFEETAMDYCVTYEVSPPSFEAPANIATAVSARVIASIDRFMLPAIIEGDCTALFGALDAYAAQYQPLVLDCSRLARVDYSAAGALLGRLRALATDGRKIDMRDMNHLVAALFKLLGYPDVVRMFPHKY
jgi:ABC-type transporter Mla MlaB component